MNTKLPLALALTLSASVLQKASAQPALAPDPSFKATLARPLPAWEWNWLQQPDGKIVIGGAFSSISSKPLKNLARLHPDGQIDESFSPHLPMDHAELAGLQSGSRTLAWISDSDQPRLVRLDTQGKLDPTFQPSGISSVLLVLSDDRLGASQSPSNLILLRPDGSAEKILVTSTVPDAFQTVTEQADGKLLIGGTFTNVTSATETIPFTDAEAANLPRRFYRAVEP